MAEFFLIPVGNSKGTKTSNFPLIKHKTPGGYNFLSNYIYSTSNFFKPILSNDRDL